jgi:hypothetical protein
MKSSRNVAFFEQNGAIGSIRKVLHWGAELRDRDHIPLFLEVKKVQTGLDGIYLPLQLTDYWITDYSWSLTRAGLFHTGVGLLHTGVGLFHPGVGIFKTGLFCTGVGQFNRGVELFHKVFGLFHTGVGQFHTGD